MSKSHVVQEGKPARSPAGRTPGSMDESGGHRQDVVGTMVLRERKRKTLLMITKIHFFFEYFAMFYSIFT